MAGMYILPMNNLIRDTEFILYSVENGITLEFLLSQRVLPLIAQCDEVENIINKLQDILYPKYSHDNDVYMKLIELMSCIIAKIYLSAIQYDIGPELELYAIEEDCIYVKTGLSEYFVQPTRSIQNVHA